MSDYRKNFGSKLIAGNEQAGNGFTLLEILIAIVILSIGLLGMASLTVGIIKGNKFSNEVTTATTLAQEKMEDVRRLKYSGMPSTNTTTPEDYNTITDYPEYKRETKTDVGAPAAGMKTITVTTYWKDANQVEHSVALKTILAQ